MHTAPSEREVERGRQWLGDLLSAEGPQKQPLLRHFDAAHASQTQEDFVESVELAVVRAREELEKQADAVATVIQQRRAEINLAALAARVIQEEEEVLFEFGVEQAWLDTASPEQCLAVALEEAEDRILVLQRENQELAMLVIGLQNQPPPPTEGGEAGKQFKGVTLNQYAQAGERASWLVGWLAEEQAVRDSAEHLAGELCEKVNALKEESRHAEGILHRTKAEALAAEAHVAQLLEGERKQSALIVHLEAGLKGSLANEKTLLYRLTFHEEASDKADAEVAASLEGEKRQSALIARLEERCEMAEASAAAIELEAAKCRAKELQLLERTQGTMGMACQDQATREAGLRKLCLKWGVRVAPMSTPMGLGEDEIEALDAFEESLCRWVEQAVQSEVERVVLSLNRHEAWAVPEIPDDVVVDGKGWDGAS